MIGRARGPLLRPMIPTFNSCTHAPHHSKHCAKIGCGHARKCTGARAARAGQRRVRACPCSRVVVRWRVLVAAARCRSDFISDTTDAYMLTLCWTLARLRTPPTDESLHHAPLPPSAPKRPDTQPCVAHVAGPRGGARTRPTAPQAAGVPKARARFPCTARPWEYGSSSSGARRRRLQVPATWASALVSLSVWATTG